MRVYELAKKWQTSSGEVLRHAAQMSIDVYSPLSPVKGDDAKKLEAVFAKRTPEQIEQERAKLDASRAQKRKRSGSRREEELATCKSALDEGRRRALEMHALAKGKNPAPDAAPPEPVVAPAASAAEPPKPMPVSQPVVAAPQPAAEVVQPTPAAPAAAPAEVSAPKAASPALAVKPAPTEKPAPAPVKAAPPPRPAVPPKSRFDDDADEDDHLSSSDRQRLSREVSRSRDFSSKPPRQQQGGGRNSVPFRGDRGDRGERGDRSDSLGPSRNQQRPAFGAGRSQPGGRQSGGFGQNRFGNTNNSPRGGYRGGAQQSVPAQKPAGEGVPADRVIALRSSVIVKDLAEKLGLRPNRLIADLMQLNVLASINQHVEWEVASKIAAKYGFQAELEKPKRSTERRPVLRSEDADDEIPEDKPEDMVPRPPVITFLGHVDHGKTSLMDRIRHAKVASGEAGGITQHIGAYSVELAGRKITFLDTPGHAAFSAMRLRGAQLTDIAVIIIAADDGIMPQTREAIAAARQAGVQIMVAINKCDLPTAKPDRVRQMLQGEGLTPEEWGGDVICVDVSAHTGQGIDQLLEMILLQADMLELTANPRRRADGYVIEAQLEAGSGPTATVLVTGGTLNVGDIVLCGEYFGKIRGLIDDRGHRVRSAGPSAAVKCMGLSGVPEAGAQFRVMLNEKRARELAERAAEEHKLASLSSSKATSLDALMRQMSSDEKRSLSVIVKADTQGSSEAICEALREIKSEKVSLEIISESIGNVLATDVSNAAAGKAVIVGFNVGFEPGVQQQARHDGVRISTYRIIYELLDYVKQCMLDLLPPEYKEVVKGHAEIRKAFDIGKTGRIAGCQLTDGALIAKGYFRIFRKKELLWTGKLLSLKHFQNEVAEVTGAQECGIHFNGYEGFQDGDTVECYVLEELPRSL